ncbi:hypothetical protein M2271_001378 [Streptomyces sp. LBL]|nr:hypothetical protein [Streptomyces sp. LBL]
MCGIPGFSRGGKTLLTDLASCPSLGATAKQPQPNPLLDNIEGMVITGRTRDRLKVLLVSDDNQNAVQMTRFFYLRVSLPVSLRISLRDRT